MYSIYGLYCATQLLYEVQKPFPYVSVTASGSVAATRGMNKGLKARVSYHNDTTIFCYSFWEIQEIHYK